MLYVGGRIVCFLFAIFGYLYYYYIEQFFTDCSSGNEAMKKKLGQWGETKSTA